MFKLGNLDKLRQSNLYNKMNFFISPARVQPIIGNSTPDMIQDHFLPIAKKLRENAMIVDQKEKQMILHKHSIQLSEDDSDFEAEVQEVCHIMQYAGVFKGY